MSRGLGALGHFAHCARTRSAIRSRTRAAGASGNDWRMRPAHKWHMPIALFAFALLVRALAIGLTQFDGLYGQDAFAYYDYARELWQRVHNLQAPEPFWWPLGYPALVALAFSLGGLTPPAAQ